MKYNRGFIITEEERINILEWCNINLKNATKISNQFFIYNISEFPNFITNVKKKIEEKENLQYFEDSTYVTDDFIAYVLKDGQIQKHTDRNDIANNLYHIRFNLFISSPYNTCNTYYSNNLIDTTECTYTLCKSGIDSHKIDVNTSDVPRITLSFGYMLPLWKIKLFEK
jgi:hypothetical protein